MLQNGDICGQVLKAAGRCKAAPPHARDLRTSIWSRLDLHGCFIEACRDDRGCSLGILLPCISAKMNECLGPLCELHSEAMWWHWRLAYPIPNQTERQMWHFTYMFMVHLRCWQCPNLSAWRETIVAADAWIEPGVCFHQVRSSAIHLSQRRIG